MKVYLYQKNREPYLWTISQLHEIEMGNQYFFETNKQFNLNGIEINLSRYVDDNFKYSIQDKFHDDGLNVLILDYSKPLKNFIELFDNNKNCKFLFIIKTHENYCHVMETEHDMFLDYIVNSNNIKVIWDISEIKFKNFYFSPKVHIQNYYNNVNFPADLFLYGKDVFEKFPNKRRVGLHFNKAFTLIRKNLIENLSPNENLYFTVNSDCIDNKKYNIPTNYKSNVFDNNIFTDKFPIEKYYDSFLNLNIRSEVEVVSETFTQNSSRLDYIKFNEKTIKHLYLGKPFLHTDPVAHKLLEINGFDSYKSLYSDELYNIYENTNSKLLLNNTEPNWVDLLVDNISWLSKMDYDQWINRVDLAMDTATKNRQRVIDLIFNTSLIDFIINYKDL